MRRSTRTLVALLVVVATLTGAVGARTADANVHASAQETCSFPFSATDATGTEVTVSEEPERIVTLAPSAAQTMWEIGGEEKVVGVSQYATYLDGAASRTNVSAAGDAWVDVETVVSLEPDLVLAPNVVPNETVDRLREAGLTVYRFRSSPTIEDIEQKTRRMGALTGECEGAGETVDWMEQRLDVVREATEGQERPAVLYVFFGYTAGEGTFTDTVITTAGGRNVAAEANITGFGQISPEIVVQQNPEWIMLNDGATAIPQTEAYNGTTAVKENQTVVVAEEHISQPAPRIVHAITKLTRALHPEAYERANSTTTETTATETTPETATTETATTAAETTAATASGEQTETSSIEAPGFGVGGAVVALAAVGLLARQRR